MRAWMVGSIVAGGLGVVTAGAGLAPPARAQEQAGWLHSLAIAREAARDSGRPILLVFR